LTSREGYEQGYQFRASIEPEAILLPTFKIDKKAFREAREEQQFLLDGGYKRLSRTQVFQANSVFHEMLVACAQNDFFFGESIGCGDSSSIASPSIAVVFRSNAVNTFAY
jgi:DNA-binding GntR family transcriptional regulator